MRSIKKATVFIALFFYFLVGNSQSALVDSLFHPDSLRHIVGVLASDSLKGRFTGTAENYKAALFIADEFEKAGLNPVSGNNGFLQEIKPAWYNVMGAMRGKSKPGQIIIFSAHYDHVGTEKANSSWHKRGSDVGDTIYNGANDNASGVAAVISLAKYFAQIDNNERTLLFVAFTGEELGLLGSQFLAEELAADSIIAMINIEMIGRAEFKYSRPYISGYEKSNLISILNRNYRSLAGIRAEKEYFKTDAYTDEHLFIRSDHYPFALKGVPAHSIQLTSPKDEFYHHVNDETETLDFETMKKVIRGIAIGATGLVNGTDTPTRIRKMY
jgi:hypothetical protein